MLSRAVMSHARQHSPIDNDPSSSEDPPPRSVFIIRHGEKPEGGAAPYGVNVEGERSESSLIPLGWQRAGALARLFDPYGPQTRVGLTTPNQLIAPGYPGGSQSHRTYETILPLTELLEWEIETQFKEGEEKALAQYVSHPGIGAALISWEHTAIPTIALNILGLANPKDVPEEWPKHRFDMVWAFTREPGSGDYVFAQIPQMLLFKDSEELFPLA
jgi:hypothetical protein